jgi:hypothetical protein
MISTRRVVTNSSLTRALGVMGCLCLSLASCKSGGSAGGSGDPAGAHGGDGGGGHAGPDAHTGPDAGRARDAGRDPDAGRNPDAGRDPDADPGHDAGEPPNPEADASAEDLCRFRDTECPRPNQCQTGGGCDPQTGECIPLVDKEAGTACDDNNACTRHDACQAGACVGSDPVVCPAPANECQGAGVCDGVTGMCSDPINKPEGTSCAADCGVSGTCSVCRGGVCSVEADLPCTNGTCSCGALGQPHCAQGASCAEGLGFGFDVDDSPCICIEGVSCECGGENQACCTDGTQADCTFNLSCGADRRCACGGEGQACCGPRLGSGTVCNVGVCSGSYAPNGRFYGLCSARCGDEGQPCCHQQCDGNAPDCLCAMGLACTDDVCSRH